MTISASLCRDISDFCCWLTYQKGVFVMDLKSMPARDADDLIDEYVRSRPYWSGRDEFCAWSRDYAAKR